MQKHSGSCLSVGGGPSDDDCICGAAAANQKLLEGLTVTITLPAKAFIAVLGNDGGYLSGECIACGGVGWMSGPQPYRFHEKNCPVMIAQKLALGEQVQTELSI